MKTPAKTISALIFVALLGGLLTIPLRGTDDRRKPAAVAQRPKKKKPSPTPAPTPKRSPQQPAGISSGPIDLAFDCTGRARVRSPRTDLIAAIDRSKGRIVTTGGDELDTFPARAPVRWSAGGLLATGPRGDIWTVSGAGEIAPLERGEVQVAMADEPSTWGWSPIADCAAVIVDGELQLFGLAGIPPAKASLIEGDVQAFSFSPSGRYIAAVVRQGVDATLWLVDLARHRLDEWERFASGTCCVALGGWTPDGDELFYWAGSGTSLMADGARLRSARPREVGTSAWGTTLPRPETLIRCGDRVLGTVGGDRSQQRNRLAVLRGGHPAAPLTETASFAEGTCSRTGDLIAIIRNGRLVLLDGSGTFIRDITTTETSNGVWGDGSPEWGPPGSGIVFERHMHLINQLWYLPEGGRAYLLTSTSAPSEAGTAMFDWLATPPNGLPSG
jgi:hypothetical protein